jgi:pyridoxine 4-dehydrogenase
VPLPVRITEISPNGPWCTFPARFFAIAGERRASGGSGAETGQLLEVARRHAATPAQVRLAWTLHQDPNVLAIPGTGNPEHLTENVAAGALHLTEQDLDVLGAVA